MTSGKNIVGRRSADRDKKALMYEGVGEETGANKLLNYTLWRKTC